MADFSITISNSMNVFGEGPATIWGDNWGDKWGEGTRTMIFQVEKLIEDSQSLAGVYVNADVIKVIGESITPSFEADTEGLYNGTWAVVFPSNTTDAEERDNASYTSGSASTTSFTCQAAGSTVWS